MLTLLLLASVPYDCTPFLFAEHTQTPLEARVRAQNEATDAALVRALALTPAELDALGSEPDLRLDAVIGTRAKWVEKDVRLHLHDQVFRHTRSFRAVQSGPYRVLFSQRIAIDTKGNAHVTPFIAEIELRVGTDRDARACVFEATRPLAFGALKPSMFVRPAAGARVGCDGCHGHGCENFDLLPRHVL